MVEATDEDHRLAQYLKRAAAMAARLWIEPDSRHRAMSALCQQRTHAPQQTASLFYHLIGAGNNLTNRDFCAVATPARWASQCLDDKRIAKRIRDYLHKENAMPRTKVSVPDVAEVAPGLWSNAIRAGDMLFISGQVARPFEGGTGIVGKDEYEQTKQIFSRIDRIIKAAGGTMDNLVKMTIYVVNIKNNTEVWRARREFFTGDFPASTLVEVRSLAGSEVLVEIETVAYLGRS